MGGRPKFDRFYIFLGSNKMQRSCDGRGGAQRPVWGGNDLKMTGARKRGQKSLVQYTYSHREGRGGGELNQREGERGNRGEHRLQSWVENANMTECTQENGYLQSMKSDKHLPQNPLL